MSLTNLIPLAGAGARFSAVGYTDPKPLIPVDDQPMIIRATSDLPKPDRWIFLCRAEQLKCYPLEETLTRHYPKSSIISVTKLTAGQASTCLLAKELINNDDELLIGACDNGMIYDQAAWQALNADQQIDAVVFTFRNHVTVARNPKAYGWVEVDTNNLVKRVSVKQPISANPKRDHAVVGVFWFRHGRNFVAAAEDMIAKNTRVNNEFYVDECINNAIQLGQRIKVFEIDRYICWGTPNDLATYQYWKDYFQSQT